MQDQTLDKASLFIERLLVAIHPSLGRLYLWKRRFWNMMIVGGTGYFIQLCLQYIFLYGLGLPLPLAVLIAVFGAFLFNYFFYENWVFKR